ncbi:MAG: hypothetical protein PVI79_02300 [Gammaproteobacteria bacterium]|jgi:hypothetical protein
MNDDSSETIRQLIRLANDQSLDRQSRQTICAIAQHTKSLHNVSRKISALDEKLKAFGRTVKSTC